MGNYFLEHFWLLNTSQESIECHSISGFCCWPCRSLYSLIEHLWDLVKHEIHSMCWDKSVEITWCNLVNMDQILTAIHKSWSKNKKGRSCVYYCGVHNKVSGECKTFYVHNMVKCSHMKDICIHLIHFLFDITLTTAEPQALLRSQPNQSLLTQCRQSSGGRRQNTLQTCPSHKLPLRRHTSNPMQLH